MRESSSVSILDGDDVVYVARVPVSRIMTVGINIGTRFPAFATSMGRVLLAGLPADELAAYLDRVRLTPLTGKTITTPDALGRELDRVRSDGFCLVDQELEEGLRSIAAPIRDGHGAVVAAANVSTQAARHSADAVRTELLPALLDATRAIEIDLLRVSTGPNDKRGTTHA